MASKIPKKRRGTADKKRIAANMLHLQDREASVRQNEREFAEMKKGWAALQKLLAEREHEIDKLKADAKTQRVARNQLRRQLKQAQAQAADTAAETGKYAKLQGALETMKAEFDAQAATLRQTQEEAQKDSEAQAALVARLKSELTAATSANKHAAEQLRAALDNIANNHKRLEDQQLTLEQRTQEVRSLGENLSGAQRETDALERRLQQETEGRRSAEQRVEELLAELAREREAKRGLSATLSEQRAQHTAAWAERQRDLEARIRELTNDRRMAEAREQQLERRVETAERRGQEASKEVWTLKEELKRARDRAAEAEAAGAKAQASEMALARLRKELEASQSSVDSLRTKLADRQREHESARSEWSGQRQELEAELVEARSRLQGFTDSVRIARERAKASDAILGEYKSQVEKLKGQLAKTREKCKSMQADEVKRTREGSKDAQRVKDLEADVQNLKMMLESVKIERRTKDKELSRLRKQLRATGTMAG